MTYDEWMPALVGGLGFCRLERIPDARPLPGDFARLEEKLGGAVPPDYRYFIERWGGGYLGGNGAFVEVPIVEPCPWGEEVCPETWYPLIENEDSIDRVLSLYRGRIPVGVLPCTHDAFGNLVCLDVAGTFPGSVWFWDHEQRWFFDHFTGTFEEAAREVERFGIDASRFSIHDIVRAWARLHAARWDRPPDYMGMYRVANSFTEFLRSLRSVRYDSLSHNSQ